MGVGRADGGPARAAGPVHVLPRWEPGIGPLPPEPDTLFVLDPRGEAAVLAEGGRLSDEYSAYFAPTTTKAPLVPGPFGRNGVGQVVAADRPALVYPVDGLLPLDEFTLSLWVRLLRADASPTTLLHAARVLWVTVDGAGGSVDVELRPFGATASVAVDGDALPVGAWRPVTVVWDGAALTVTVGRGDARRSAVAKATVTPDVVPPASWCDGGLLLMDGAAVGEPAVELAEVVVNRWARTESHAVSAPGPTLRVDAAAGTGRAWSPSMGGALAIYTGMRPWEDGLGPDVGTSIRDQQFHACADAGFPIVRVSGLVSGALPTDDGGLDFAAVDEKLAIWRERGVALHVTLDYNHPRTGAAVRSWDGLRQPPDDFDVYAATCSEVIAHLQETGQRIASVALWNEPDIEEYWAASREQFHELWAAVQRRLAVDHPGLPLGTGDWAHAENAAEHLRWIAARGLPVAAAYFHNYDQDLASLTDKVRMLRAVAVECGMPELPIRCTEWGMHILRQQELYLGSTSVNRAWPNRFATAASAAWITAFFAEVTAADPWFDMGAFSCVGAVDRGLLVDASWFVADEAMFSEDDPPRPYPSFNAMSLVWKLRGDRVACESNWPSVRGIATVDGDGRVVVVFGSYRPWRGHTDTVDVALEWDGLPERFTWKHWIVDDHHAADARLQLVAEGTEADLPTGTTIGCLSAAGFELTPR